ncbi:hypothetical protein HMPREF9506_01783 [Enterococcus faecalis TX0309A]|nr:hypothetical protein HMPREF0346_1737 [Enterococcus faecalis EnGen0297]EFU85368.1 hypothetical protein HMPREF9507_03208 [Enterococcus faecalis TX0309B]EFU93446.1 hypothetical protein HMPREF9506_01783 [Enterococcus faecalis TX0309A]EPI04341.1 hypothetical protein D840_01365 [Enterococcus faecalis 20.SD.W.06]EPI35611.1 hypothetical protein D348_01963 [Enterococcus faecalis SLO2C-1]KDE17627.1 hypothetical protein HMPREF2097_01331 [Enterococcus faecalis 918]
MGKVFQKGPVTDCAGSEKKAVKQWFGWGSKWRKQGRKCGGFF